MDGHAYAFYSIARDNVGYTEAAPSLPDAVTTIGAWPAVQSEVLNGGLIQRSKMTSLALTFSKPVTVLGTITLLNLDSGEQFTASDCTVVAQTATWNLSGLLLTDGYYSATLPAGAVQDTSANGMAADHVTEFHVLAGDATGDGRVNAFDLLKVRQNYLLPSGAGRDDNADVTGDGNVNIFDLLLILQNFPP